MNSDERERINHTKRADLRGLHAPLAGALDDWLVAEHGVMSSSHAVGSFLADLAEAGLQIIPAECGPDCCPDFQCNVPWHHRHRLQNAPDLKPSAVRELDELAHVEGPGKAAAVLTIHQRHGGGCLCGTLALGQSHAAHQVDELRAAGVLS